MADELNEITIVVRAVYAPGSAAAAAKTAVKEASAVEKAAAKESAAVQKSAAAEAVAAKKAAAAEIKATVESEAIAEKAAAAEVAAAAKQADAEAVAAKKAAAAELKAIVDSEARAENAAAAEAAAVQRKADAEAVAAKRAAMAEIRAAVESEAIAEKAAAAEAAAAAKKSAADQAAVRRELGADSSLLGGKGAAVAIAAAAVLAAKSASTWQAQMVRLATSAGESGGVIDQKLTGNLKLASDQLLQVSRDTATSTDQIAKGAYMVESSGYHAANGLQKVMQAAAEGARAEGAPLETMTSALTGFMKAYHMTADQAVSATNMMVAAVGSGKMTMAAFASSLSMVLPIASAAGVKANEVFGAMASLTVSGSTTARMASNEVAAAIKAFVAPNEVAKKTFTGLGLSVNDLSMKLGQRGLLASLNLVQEAIKKHQDATGLVHMNIGGKPVVESPEAALKAAMGGVIGMRAAMSLGGEAAKEYAANVASIGAAADHAGAHVKGWADITGTMKFKFDQFINDIKIFAIQIGNQLLPTLGNLGRIGEEAFSGFQPILSAAGLALTLFLQGLGELTGFLASHKTIVEAFALMFGMTMVKNFVMGSTAIASLTRVITPAIAAVRTFGAAYAAFGAQVAISGTLSGAVAGVKALGAALMTWSNVAMAAVAAGVITYQTGMNNINKANDEAKASVSDMTKGFDAFDTKGAQQMLDQLRAKAAAATAEGKNYSGIIGTFKLGWNSLTGSGGTTQIAASGLAASNAYRDLSQKMVNAKENVTSLTKVTGLSAKSIQSIATSAGIDLTQAFDQSGKARLAVIQDIGKMADAAQTSAASIVQAVGDDKNAMDAFTKSIQEAQKAAGNAFLKDFDVISGWESPSSVNAATSAGNAVTKAQEAVAAAQKRLGDGAKITASHQVALAKAGVVHAASSHSAASATDALANAQARLVKAQAAAAKAGASPGGGSLADYYKKTLSQARTFTQELAAAEAKGLDPQLIARLISAGPAAAKPMLDAIAKDATGNLVKMVNSGEAELAKLSAFAIEQARLTAIATGATATSQFSLDFSKAAKISSSVIAAQGQVTAEQLAAKLHIPAAEITRIANEFTIGLQTAIDAHPLTPPKITANDVSKAAQYLGSVLIPHHAAGGVAGGLTGINEQGQESVRLPNGSVVYPHANTVTHNETHPVIINVGKVVTNDASSFTDWGRSQGSFSGAGVR